MEARKNSIKRQLPLTPEDFERLRCSKCGGYLNCPPIVAYLGKNRDYLECGRCYNEEATKLQGIYAVRNYTLESLANITPFPCKNHQDGCTERRTWPQLEMHEKECLHRAFNCPLSFLENCQYRGGIQKLLQHFQEEHSERLISDSILKESFDKDFENYYLVHQNNNVFVLQVKCDINIKKLWFTTCLLEEDDPAVCNFEFIGKISENSFIIKHTARFEPLTALDTDKALEIDMNAINSLLKETESIGCRIRLSPKFPALRSADLLKEIQCPACWEFMTGKTFMCKNGHNTCSKCKDFVKHCPTCRDEILDIRNLALEQVIRCTLFPCKYHAAGCIYIGTMEELLYHLNYCRFTS